MSVLYTSRMVWRLSWCCIGVRPRGDCKYILCWLVLLWVDYFTNILEFLWYPKKGMFEIDTKRVDCHLQGEYIQGETSPNLNCNWKFKKYIGGRNCRYGWSTIELDFYRWKGCKITNILPTNNNTQSPNEFLTYRMNLCKLCKKFHILI